MIELENTILITGGAGFIGAHLCKAFIADGFKVICFDNLLTGKKENIAALLNHPAFNFIEGDIRDLVALKAAMVGVDFVSHQAALGSVPRSIANPIPTSEINTQGFLNVLTVAKDAGVKRFVYASSSSVYGDAKLSPKQEANIGKPLSPYAVSKLTNEHYGELFHKLYEMETIGLRYFNVFGKNQDPNGVYAAAIPKFIDLLINGNAPQIYGDGNQTRDFTHITNVVHANRQAVFGANKTAFGEAFNVACGNAYTVNQVIDTIIEALEANGVILKNKTPQHLPERRGDIRDSLADISKIQQHLGYQVQTSFTAGMQQYVKSLLLDKALI